MENRHGGCCHIHYLNAAVYKDWLHESAYIVHHWVDFIPHKGSIDGIEFNQTMIQLT